MELKQDNENDEFPRKYFHMKRRLTKAARWSSTLKNYVQSLVTHEPL